MLDDPRVNFALSARGAQAGVNHLGLQLDSEDELRHLRAQVAASGIQARDEPGADCCYARSDKYWIEDPQGLAWETFHTLGEIPVFGRDTSAAADKSACCAPQDSGQRPKAGGCCG
jgi:hypothetical protein